MPTEQEKESLIHRIGRWVAGELKRAGLPSFYGNVQVNIKDGNYVNANVEQTFMPKPEKREKAGSE